LRFSTFNVLKLGKSAAKRRATNDTIWRGLRRGGERMSVVVVLFGGFASCGERISYKLALASRVKGSYT